MNKLDSAIVENKESTCQVSHPAIGKIYCLNAPEARATLHEICDDQLYLQAGVSISAGDVVVDIGANIGVFTLYAAKQGAQVYAYETYAAYLCSVTAECRGAWPMPAGPHPKYRAVRPSGRKNDVSLPELKKSSKGPRSLQRLIASPMARSFGSLVCMRCLDRSR
jgi:hypothetical protein